ncbi:MAG: tetratricopeptide repeat protein, partial [Gloeomargaritaceae cyanobacterium C42_A2020_066]|nr:tetratricopeptide repeat protein [Gloeomargaritaceae cyanobacterium C42_A2020_066]
PPPPRPAAPPPAAVDPRDRYVEQYYKRAVDYRKTKQYAQAHQELQDALKLDPNNCRCLNLRGQIYLEQKQSTMAKIQFERVLKLNPQDADAQEGMEVIAKLKGQAGANRNGTQPETAPPKSAKGGLFGLFGKGK